MEENTTKDDKLKKEIAKIIWPHIINDLLRSKVILEDDLSNQNVLWTKIKDFLAKNPDAINYDIVVDHRATLLGKASDEYQNGSIDIAIALYATYIEHTLNLIISVHCKSKNIDIKTQTEVIKNININGKSTWLLKLLGLPPLKPKYVKLIENISNERNSYLHYKWKPQPDELIDTFKIDKKKEDQHVEIKALIKYLKNYQARHEFQGRKTKITNVI